MTFTRQDLERSGEVLDRLQELWNSPVEFGRLWHNGVLERDGTRRKEYSRVHAQMTEHMLGSQFTSTVISRNHAKTTLAADVALHEKWTNINETFMYCSAGTDLATGILSTMKGIAESHELLPIIPGELEIPFYLAFPELVPTRAPAGSPIGSWNCAGRSLVAKEPCFFPRSPRSAKAGLHPHRIYVDDVANENNSGTPQMRAWVIDFIRQLVPILFSQSEGVIRVIGTPWAFWDVSAWLQMNPIFNQLRLGCWDGWNPDTGLIDGQGPGPNGGWPLAPSFMTAAELFQQEQTIDNNEFWSQQYLCEPVAAANAIFTKDLIAAQTVHAPVDAIPKGRHILLWDPTSRTNPKEGDWNGLIVVRVLTASRYRRQCKRTPSLGFPGLAELPDDANLFIPVEAHEVRGAAGDCMPLAEELHSRWGLDAIWVEDTGAAGAIMPWLHEKHWVREANLNLRPIKISSKTNKDNRLTGIQLGIKEGRLVFPAEYAGGDILTQRLLEYPKSESDDLPDALALLTNHMMRRGQLFTPEDPGPCYDPRSVNYTSKTAARKPRNHKW